MRIAAAVCAGIVGLVAFSCVKVQPATDTGDSLSGPTSTSTSGGPVATPAPTPAGTPASPGPASTPTPAPSPTPTTTAALAYNPDMIPIFEADCVTCHRTGRAEHGYSMSSYAETMRAVRAGQANSTLIRVTQRNGSMYRYWSGSQAGRDQKMQMTSDWIVRYNAAERR